MHRDRLSVKHSKREDDPILFPNGEREREEKLPHVHHPAWMQVFPAQRRTSSVEETTATLWERMIYGQCSSMQLQFLLPFHRLRKVGFLSLFPSLRIFPQPVVPCIFLSCPVEISLASSFFPRVTIGNFISWRCFSPSLSLVISLSLSRLILRVGKIAVSILSPSELYTRYIMNIVISRRSYTVRSFLKWKSTGKVGRGLRVTFHLLDPPALESSYRLSRLSSTTSSVAFATVTYFTSSIAFLFFFHSFLLFLFSSLLLLLK